MRCKKPFRWLVATNRVSQDGTSVHRSLIYVSHQTLDERERSEGHNP